MKELIIKKGDKQITVADKEDVMDALDNKSDNTHNHDSTYIKKTGGVSQHSNGNIIIPSESDTTDNNATGKIPFAGHLVSTTYTIEEFATKLKSFMGGLKDKNNRWWNVISARQTNGGGSNGEDQGLLLKTRLEQTGDLIWNKQYTGDWGTERTILDSSNYSNYANKTTVSNSLTDTSTTNALSAKQGKILNDRYKGIAISGGNVPSKPYLRLFNIESTASSSSGHLIFEMFGINNDSSYAKVRVDLRRTSNSPPSGACSVVPLNISKRSNIYDNLYFAHYIGTDKSYVDIFFKTAQYKDCIFKIYDDQLRNGKYTMYQPIVAANAANDVETYTTVEEAGTALYNASYTNIINKSYNDIVASSFIKDGGTSSQFLKADGSVDSNTYSTSGHNHDSTYIKTGTGTVTSTNIADKTIVNGDIADNAAIAYSKLSGVAASTHSHSYLPLSGGTMTGPIKYPQLRTATSEKDSLPYAGVITWDTNWMTTVKARKSMIGTVDTGNGWFNVLSIRHRNGTGDGNAWGMILKAPLTTSVAEANANLTWQRDLNGTASTEKTIIDTNNMVQHKVVNNVLTRATNNQGTAGYFKILTIGISGNYIDSPIQFTINKRLTPTTNVQFYVQFYQKDTSSSSNPRYYKLNKCYYDGQALGLYVKQTVDNANAGTFDIYTDAEAWSDLSVTPIITNNLRNSPANVTITPKDEFVTSLPSGCTQATRNPNYVAGDDSRLTNARTPTSHTDSNGAYGKATTSVWGHTKLNSATNSTDETTAATPKAVKAAYDLANGKAPSSHTHTKSQITDFPTSMTPTSHSHGSIANGGTLNSDITSVNKVAVTDSSNNLKTISKVPFGNLNITKANITGLGIPGSDTNTTYSAGTGLNLSSTTFSVKYGTAAGTACQGNDSRITNLLSNSVKLSFRTSNSISAGIINPMSVSISKGSNIYIGCVDLNGNAKTDGNVGILVNGVNSIGLKAVSNGIASSAINYNAGNYFLTVSYFDSSNQAVASMVGKLTVT